ncbi:hypothetical protein SMD44_p10213 (plasmid) [Streptomyces alboflavus]|uniref:Uncharacterized protein n=1 Tax=Streptomyces alboflavus TaxID=67267 RepID=A0A291W588_9ACTN|nr:hypothetical protein [Streptomyces alboflavus]ATM24712.1 hypothetical protein SMD44_p10213 [Streptomyces alboflavus]
MSVTAPFADSRVLEDSALMAVLGLRWDNAPSGDLYYAPDSARLVPLGLASVDSGGQFRLTSDGLALARGLRLREQLLISDDVLEVVLSRAGRAHGKATGWIAGITSTDLVYIEMVPQPRTTPEQPRLAPEAFTEMITQGPWTGIPQDLRRRLGMYAKQHGARIYLGAPRMSGAQMPEHLRTHRLRAARHAAATWNDLCRDHRVLALTEPGGDHTQPAGLLFHHAGRDVRLSRDPQGRPHAEVVTGPTAVTGDYWTGHRFDYAVAVMCADLYATPCAHGLGTGRDSCPGCDATAEAFQRTHGSLLAPMPPLT